MWFPTLPTCPPHPCYLLKFCRGLGWRSLVWGKQLTALVGVAGEARPSGDSGRQMGTVGKVEIRQTWV